VSFLPRAQTTGIAHNNDEDIFVRNKSLCKDLIGKLSFTQMIYFQILGRIPTDSQSNVLDACLVTLMEHGLTPSTLTSRLVYSSAPEAMQSAVGAGLACVGSVFVGTMDSAAVLIKRLLQSKIGVREEAYIIAKEYNNAVKRIPGFGHHIHKPDDPRTMCLFKVAERENISGDYIKAIKVLSKEIDQVFGKHITINATGAVAAVLGDCGVPAEIMRGFALISRAAGLVGHIHEEQTKPAMRVIWEAAESSIPYHNPKT